MLRYLGVRPGWCCQWTAQVFRCQARFDTWCGGNWGVVRKCAQMPRDQFKWDPRRSAQDNLSQLLQSKNVIIIITI